MPNHHPHSGETMKRVITLIAALVFVGTVAFAHGGNEHVRGVVTSISPESISVQTADKSIKTLTVTAKTALKRGTKGAQLSDLKVGDRVVVDVPEKGTTALQIQIGAASQA